jgi:hypothetical protein
MSISNMGENKKGYIYIDRMVSVPLHKAKAGISKFETEISTFESKLRFVESIRSRKVHIGTSL